MNISILKGLIKHCKTAKNPSIKESIFSNKVKNTLKYTNFELIGEEICVYNGACDLWLSNYPHNFLLSLELKTGEFSDIKKQEHLQYQVYKYTNAMHHYYPRYMIYGFGAYKCENKILFFDHDVHNSRQKEIIKLKRLIAKC